MKHSKRIIALTFLLITQQSLSQIADWYGSDLSRFGYKFSKIQFESAKNGHASEWEDNPFKIVNGHSFELSADIYTKHMYFSLDGSALLDITFFYFTSLSDKERWWKNSEFRMDRSEIFPIRLAFGLPITKYANIYAGGQYQYAIYAMNPLDQTNNPRTVDLRGNQYGVGIHFVGGYKMINLRYSFMYDWMLAPKKPTDGMALTNEIGLFFGVKKFGGFVKMNSSFRKMNAYFENEQSNPYYKVYNPSEYVEQFSLSVGIYAEGLFTGITRATSKTVGTTEIENAKERERKKKQRIEWKD